MNFRKLVRNAYVIALMCFALWYGKFMYPLIFGFEHKEEAGKSLADLVGPDTDTGKFFAKLVHAPAESIKRVDLGYRVIDEPYVKGHFHHIGFSIQSDRASVCVLCHGSVPHDASKEIRSFLNMHTFYIGCEACHIHPAEGEPAPEFRWYDKATGEPVPNPPELVEIENTFSGMKDIDRRYVTYGNYGAKIAPGVLAGGKFEFLKRGNLMAYVVKFLESQASMEESQQSQVKHLIHRDVNEEPIQCENCHNTAEPYIPFSQLGYPPRRVQELTNTAAVGMIRRYEQFWIPDLGGTPKTGNQ